MKIILVQIFEVPDEAIKDPKIPEGTYPGTVVAAGQWSVNQADVNGRVRAQIGEFLSKHIGQHRYHAANWIKNNDKRPIV